MEAWGYLVLEGLRRRQRRRRRLPSSVLGDQVSVLKLRESGSVEFVDIVSLEADEV